jgi:LuxR family maltose regulon positive regulatory protein
MPQKPNSILLATKSILPPLRTNVISRKQLFNRLNKGLEDGIRLILITASAGYGKTVLTRSWLEKANVSSGWLSLDKDDNNPIDFWTYFIAATQNVFEVGETAWAMLHSPQIPSIEVVLTTLINDLLKKDTSFLLTLDDYHIIHNATIHEGISFLLDHLPPKMHLLIISREKPPLSLTKLRAHNQLLELQTSDLKFTYDETDTFINQVMGLNLSREKVEFLGKHMDGWIAGLQMAALSMQGLDPNDTSEFISRISNSEGYIMDYLLEEVFASQSEVIQNYLLRTSILDRLNDELCNSVSCFEKDMLPELGKQTMLEYLTSQKLFTIPLSNNEKWYRYHDIFSEFLQHYLNKTQPEIIPSLHQCAAEWFEAHGFYFEAIKHSIASGNDLNAVKLVEQNTLQLIMRGEVAIAENWINMLPEKDLYLYPRVCLNKAWCMYRTGRLQEVELLLLQTEKILGSSNTFTNESLAGMKGEINAIRAAIMDLNGNNTGAIHLLKKALKYLPPDQVFTRCICKLFLSQSLARAEGYSEEAAQVLAKCISLCKESGNLENLMLLITGVVNELVKKYIWQGYLNKAKTIVQDALTLIKTEGLDNIPTVSYLYNAMGKVFLECYDLENAESNLKKGLDLDSSGVTDASIECYLTLARVKQANGRNEEVKAIFDRLSETMAENDNPEKIETVVADRIECQLGQGNTKNIEYWFNKIGLNPLGPTSSDKTLNGRRRLLRNSGYVMLARFYFLSKQYDVTLNLLEELLSFTESKGWVGQTIELLGLQSLTFDAIGDSTTATQILEKALTLAEPEGYARAFLDKGYPMVYLLNKNLNSSINSSYIKKLLIMNPLQNQTAALPINLPFSENQSNNKEQIPERERNFRSTSSISYDSTQPQIEYFELLSDREVDVLNLLAERLSDKEIAIKLCLSINTIKGHNRSIYQKLGVKGRRQAVKKVMEFHILSKQ